MRYAITVQYDGGRYEGWQRQKSTDNTIQGKLEDVLTALDGAPVQVSGAGRTDAGAHALGQAASFDLSREMPAPEVMAYLNRYLPKDIAVVACREAPPRFHARLNAREKEYRYDIRTDSVPDVFARRYQYALGEQLDVPAMRRAAALLCGTHDFAAFCTRANEKKSTVRTIKRISLDERGGVLRITFVGDGFLYNMARILAGTLVEVGQGRRAAEGIPAVLSSKKRENAGFTAPAQGLTLVRVTYDGADA